MRRLNLPNLLTITRMFGAMVFLFFLLEENWHWSMIIFSAAALTDMIDGTIARMLSQRTRLGGFLDPMADKILMFCGFFVLTMKGIIPIWITAVVVARDVFITTGIVLFVIRRATFSYHPTYLSKAATLFQILTLFFFLADLYRGPSLAANAYVLGTGRLFFLTGFTAILTCVTGVQYAAIGLRVLRGTEN